MKILFFLAVWKRPEITEQCFMGLQRLMRHGVSSLAVISETEMIPLCQKYGIYFCFHGNEPVGMKKNFGLTQALKRDWDYLIELGSDDVIQDGLIDAYMPSMKEGKDFIGARTLLMTDSVTGECREFEFDGELVMGLGRCFSRRLVEHFSGKVLVQMNLPLIVSDMAVQENECAFLTKEQADEFEHLKYGQRVKTSTHVHLWDNLNRGLDNNSTSRILRNGFTYTGVETKEPLMMDIKSDENIWGFNPEIGKVGDLEKFLSKLTQEERALFFSNQKKLRAKRIEKAA